MLFKAPMNIQYVQDYFHVQSILWQVSEPTPYMLMAVIFYKRYLQYIQCTHCRGGLETKAWCKWWAPGPVALNGYPPHERSTLDWSYLFILVKQKKRGRRAEREDQFLITGDVKKYGLNQFCNAPHCSLTWMEEPQMNKIKVLHTEDHVERLLWSLYQRDRKAFGAKEWL
jgi:hypothetical protein